MRCKKTTPLSAIGLLCILGLAAFMPHSAFAQPNWQTYSAASFEKARNRDKLILLNLEAVWCHWCHVMEATTYRDPRVIDALDTHFISISADHDERPDLAERYREWGWPATIIMTANGDEILKRAGYIEPDAMARMLDKIIEDPSPELESTPLPDAFNEQAKLDHKTRKTLINRHTGGQDETLGGLNINQRFLDADTISWDLTLATQGDRDAERRVRLHLDAALKLIDPEFGGAYQYSTHGDWEHPHYEKIMYTQWAYMTSYSAACMQLKEPRYCDAARSVADYVIEFLSSPGGAFFNSQDADLKQGTKAHEYFSLSREERLKMGLPKVDKNRYASGNGQAIEGLVAVYRATGIAHYLSQAEQAMAWIHDRRVYYGGGYRHAHKDPAGPYLPDTLYLARAKLALFKITGKGVYRERAFRAAQFIDRYFRHSPAGFTSAVDNGTPIKPVPSIDQNIHATGFFLDLAKVINNSTLPMELAEYGMRFLATPAIAKNRYSDSGILLLDERFARLKPTSINTQGH